VQFQLHLPHGPPHPGDSLLMFGSVDQVVDVVEVLDGIVELFRDARPEEPSRDLIRLAFFVVLFPRRRGQDLPQVR